MKMRFLCLLAPCLLAACAGEVEMRSVAGQSAAILTQYRTSVQDYAAGQTALNAASVKRLDQLRRQRSDREAEIANRRDGWTLSEDERAIRRFAAVTRVRAEDIIARDTPLAETAPPDALKYDSAAVDALLKDLVQLSKPTALDQRLKGLAAFGTTLQGALRDDLAEDAQASRATAQQTTENAAALTESDAAGELNPPPSEGN